MTRESPGPPLSYALTRLARQISRGLSDVHVLDLSGPQVVALLALHEEPGLSNAQLARRSFVTPQAMNEVVLDLERRGLVTRKADPSNQRIRRAHLTADGRKAIRSVEKRIAQLESRLLEGFSDSEAQRFRRSIGKAGRNMGLPSSGQN